jgi:hypothetical protein
MTSSLLQPTGHGSKLVMPRGSGGIQYTPVSRLITKASGILVTRLRG